LSSILGEVGFAGALLVRPLTGGTYAVIDGHERVQRFQDRERVPCLVTDLDETEARKILATFDRIGSLAEIDGELLKELSESFQFDHDDLTALIDEVTAAAMDEDGGDVPDVFPETKLKTGNTDPDEIPKVSKRAKFKRGSFWKLGRHRLLCDEVSQGAVDRLTENKPVDLLVVDPPETLLAAGTDGEFPDLAELCKVAAESIPPGCPFYFFYPQTVSLSLAPLEWSMSDVPLLSKQFLIYRTLESENDGGEYLQAHDCVLYGWKEGAGHPWFGGRAQSTIIPVDNLTAAVNFRPVGMFTRFLINSTEPKARVLNLHAAAGPVVIAAEQTGRAAVVIEEDPRMCDVIIRRWERFTGKKAVRK
jgi:hypothetical protein